MANPPVQKKENKTKELKEYSVIPTLFYFMTLIRGNKQNKKTKNKKKSLFPKFQLILILPLQVMHDYVVFHCSIDCCVESSLLNDN